MIFKLNGSCQVLALNKTKKKHWEYQMIFKTIFILDLVKWFCHYLSFLGLNWNVKLPILEGERKKNIVIRNNTWSRLLFLGALVIGTTLRQRNILTHLRVSRIDLQRENVKKNSNYVKKRVMFQLIKYQFCPTFESTN